MRLSERCQPLPRVLGSDGNRQGIRPSSRPASQHPPNRVAFSAHRQKSYTGRLVIRPRARVPALVMRIERHVGFVRKLLVRLGLDEGSPPITALGLDAHES
jgi:hypothetical protein